MRRKGSDVRRKGDDDECGKGRPDDPQRRAAERRLTGEQEVQGAAEAVDVRAGIDRRAFPAREGP